MVTAEGLLGGQKPGCGAWAMETGHFHLRVEKHLFTSHKLQRGHVHECAQETATASVPAPARPGTHMEATLLWEGWGPAVTVDSSETRGLCS